jgi:hypothetical protein
MTKRRSKSLIITSKLFLEAIGNYLKEGGDICFNTLKSPRGFRLKILIERRGSVTAKEICLESVSRYAEDAVVVHGCDKTQIIADNLSKAGWSWAASQSWIPTGEPIKSK